MRLTVTIVGGRLKVVQNENICSFIIIFVLANVVNMKNVGNMGSVLLKSIC